MGIWALFIGCFEAMVWFFTVVTWGVVLSDANKRLLYDVGVYDSDDDDDDDVSSSTS